MTYNIKPIVIFLLFLACKPLDSHAQLSVNVTINHPPKWAPRQYASHVRYYYIPEYDLYYDARRQGYFYESGNRWLFTPNLPPGFHEDHLMNTERVVVNYFGDYPYDHFSHHRITYLRRYHPHWGAYGWRRPPGYRYQVRPQRPVYPVRPGPPGRPNPGGPGPVRPNPGRPRPNGGRR